MIDKRVSGILWAVCAGRCTGRNVMSVLDELFSIEGQIAVVTGAANGFGRLFAQGLARAGVDLALMDIDEEGLLQTADLVRAAGRQAASYVVDVSHEQDVAATFRSIAADLGSPDILVNNAGIGGASNLMMHQYSSEVWHKLVAVNLNSVFYCSRAALALMHPRGRGKIVNLASIWGMVGGGFVRTGGYAATKGAIVNLTREMGVQYASAGIQINAICPGFHRTTIMDFDDPEMKEVVNKMTLLTPAARIADASELLGTLIYLASPASNFMSGSIITVDGGFLAQ